MKIKDILNSKEKDILIEELEVDEINAIKENYNNISDNEIKKMSQNVIDETLNSSIQEYIKTWDDRYPVVNKAIKRLK